MEGTGAVCSALCRFRLQRFLWMEGWRCYAMVWEVGTTPLPPPFHSLSPPYPPPTHTTPPPPPQEDVELVFANARAYNPPHHHVHMVGGWVDACAALLVLSSSCCLLASHLCLVLFDPRTTTCTWWVGRCVLARLRFFFLCFGFDRDGNTPAATPPKSHHTTMHHTHTPT